MINGDFAQLTEFVREKETYKFKAAIYLENESILEGHKAAVLIRPNLFVNGRMASNDLLKNTKVTLTTRNATDNMPVSKTFDGLKTLDNKEIVVEFQVPSLL